MSSVIGGLLRACYDFIQPKKKDITIEEQKMISIKNEAPHSARIFLRNFLVTIFPGSNILIVAKKERK